MKRSLLGLGALCLIGGLLAGDIWAWGPRGGPAMRGGPGMHAGGSPGIPGPAVGGPQIPTPGPAYSGPSLPSRVSGAPFPAPSHVNGADRGGRNPQPGHTQPQGLQQFLADSQRTLSERAQQARTTAADWAGQWTSTHPEPFSPAWYAQHPNAWHYTHPHADAAVVATSVGIAAWLTAPLAVAGGSTASGGDVAMRDESSELTASSEPAPTGPEPTPTTPTALGDDVPWMTIGAFQLKPSVDAKADRAIQLAVSQDGTVRGSHYDLISNEVQDIYGAVNRQTLEVTWKIGARGKVVFEVPLDELTKEEGQVTVHRPNGATETWVTLRVAKNP